jgi:hypothetical protein
VRAGKLDSILNLSISFDLYLGLSETSGYLLT